MELDKIDSDKIMSEVNENHRSVFFVERDTNTIYEVSVIVSALHTIKLDVAVFFSLRSRSQGMKRYPRRTWPKGSLDECQQILIKIFGHKLPIVQYAGDDYSFKAWMVIPGTNIVKEEPELGSKNEPNTRAEEIKALEAFILEYKISQSAIEIVLARIQQGEKDK